MRLLAALLWFTALWDATGAISWLAFREVPAEAWNSTRLCRLSRQNHGFVKRQQKLCRRYRDVMRHVHTASHSSVDNCQRLFARHRWNCSSVTFAPSYSRDLTAGTREQAFVYANSAASLMHAVARACSAGTIFYCGCGRTPRRQPEGNFKWGGCGDNTKFGQRFARKFVDSPDRRKSKRKSREEKLRAKVNLHNNRAGSKAVQKSLTIQCKCHGVSGSCSIKTCWRALPSLLTIGERLQRKYRGAIEVSMRRVGSRLQMAPATTAMGRFSQEDLIYNAKSPDYCSRDESFGSLGTSGRQCNASSSAHDGCQSMCCGRPYNTFTVERIERCQCKYVWCCYVKCKTCRSWVDVHECT